MPHVPDPQHDPRQVFAERVQFVAAVVLIVFLVGWCVWFYPYDDLLDRSGTPLGADYAMFYVAGQIVLDGASDELYEQAEHQRRLQQLFPAIDPRAALPYRYPPFVALLMAPLAALPYVVSYGVFLAASCACGLTALRLLCCELGCPADLRPLVYLAFAGWPVALETIIGGQASMFALLLMAATTVLLRHRRYLAAGAVIALAAYKPNVLLLVGVGCVLYRPRTLRGVLPAAALLVALSLAAGGWQGLVDYYRLTTQLAVGSWDVDTPFWKVHSLSSWLGLLVEGRQRLLGLLLGLLAVTGVVWRWRRAEAAGGTPLLISLALLVTINALANAYTPIYDLTLLAAGVLLTAASLGTGEEEPWRRHLPAAQLLLAILFLGPHMSQSAARLLGVQLFPLALLAAAVWQTRLFLAQTRLTAPATQWGAWSSEDPST